MKDEIKRDLLKILPEDTSSDIITALASYAVVLVEEEKDRVKRLIVDEANIARSEDQPTSRLTSLYNKI